MNLTVRGKYNRHDVEQEAGSGWEPRDGNRRDQVGGGWRESVC